VNPRFLVLADDLTGALEAGALYARAGVTSGVFISERLPPDSSVEAVVLDIETRHSDPKRAESVVAELASDARARGISRIYLKIDSTLRGPIASQISGLRAAWPENSVIVTPAYPRMGRIVRSGSVYVNGTPLAATAFANDPLDPSCTSLVAPKVSNSAVMTNIQELRRALPPAAPGVFIVDAETDEDLAALAALIVERRASFIAVGSAGLLAELVRAEHGLHARTGLIVNGSLHRVSIEQCAAARPEFQVFELNNDSQQDLVTKLTHDVRSHGWAVLSTGRKTSDPQRIAERIADLTATVIGTSRCDSLTIFGGDTAAHILVRLQVPAIYPIRELLPGIPISRIVVDGRDVKLITKAGGFGDVDVVRRLRSALAGAA
jgi:uncharacterized protein YgbK (DUF1537 family)